MESNEVKPTSIPKEVSMLEVICGPMFAGKTEELIRRVKRYTIAKQKVQVFKPQIDSRYGLNAIRSHAKTDLEAITGVRPKVIDDRYDFELRLEIRDDTKVVAFDEAQFFKKEWLVPIIEGLIKNNIKVICAGLDLNTYGEPFGCMPTLLAMADEVHKLKAVCAKCHKDANRTLREIPYKDGVAIEIGGAGLYQACCSQCWTPTPRD